jgi:hypothetical protein
MSLPQQPLIDYIAVNPRNPNSGASRVPGVDQKIPRLRRNH